jgi:hypothetical protein
MYIELSKRIHEQMSAHQFMVSIMGNLTQDFLKSMIRVTDNRLATLDINESIRKRIFHFMVECAQNICRTDEREPSLYNSLFLIGKKDEEYSVYLGSVFDSTLVDTIIDTVDRVNVMSAPDLKEQLYAELAKKDGQQNQLLLSLLDLSKRAREKIQYDRVALEDGNTFLSFKIIFFNTVG